MLFRGRGCEVCVNKLVYCVVRGMGINPGKKAMYHMCKTWLKEVHNGWGYWGDF